MHEFLFSFFTVASLHLLAVVSPGPDYVIVTRNAFFYNRRAAVFTALGVASGIIVHAGYCLFGLAIVIANSLLLFNIIKLMGGLYLIYIGVKACFAKDVKPVNPAEHIEHAPQLSNWQALKQGFLCNILNPKVTLFFLGLFTLVIKPDTPWAVRIFYATWMITVTFAWFSLLAILITHAKVRAKIWRIQPKLTKIMGLLLIVFGANLIVFIRI